MKQPRWPKTLAVICFALMVGKGVAQTTQQKQNLEKYWNYRESLKRYFIKIGSGQGESVPANVYTPSTNSMGWGDATSWLGMYYAILASEYKLLVQDGKPTQGTLNELYYALNALNRLDDYDRKYYTGGIDVLTHRDGFFLRDDVDATLINEWTSQYATVKDDRYNLSSITSSNMSPFGSFNNWTHNVENEVSSDQIIDIFYGLRFVVDMIPANTIVQPTPADAPMDLKQEAKNIVSRIMSQFQLFHHLNSNGNWQGEPQIGAHANGDVRANWILVNPVTGFKDGAGSEPRPLAYGLAKAADKIMGTPNNWTQLAIRHQEVDQLGDGYWGADFDVSVSLNTIKTDIWDNMEQFVPNPNDVGLDNPTQYCIGLSSSITNGFSTGDICIKSSKNYLSGPSGILQPNTALMSMYLAVAGNTWLHNNIANKASVYQMYPFDLSDAILNGNTATSPYSFYENVLASAPCKGPYYHSDTDYSPEWNTSDRWEHPTYGGVLRKFEGDFVGMDYMLLYNFTHLYFKNTESLPSYDPNTNCDCANNPAIQKSFVSGTSNINTNMNVVRRFPQYKNIGIYMNEFITTPVNVISGGTINNKTTLIVCGTTVDVRNSGVLKNAVGQIASDSIKIMVRNGGIINVDANGTLEITSNTKLIIQKGSTVKANNSNAKIIIRTGGKLIVEPGGFLELNNGGTLIIEDNAKATVHSKLLSSTTNNNAVFTFNQGAQLQLKGDNAVLELNGRLHIGDNANFGFTYPGSNSGYINFNRGAGVLWDNWATGNAHITCGYNSSFKLVGQSKTDKVMVINQNVVAMPKNITQFSINKGLVEFNTFDASLESDNIFILNNATLKGIVTAPLTQSGRGVTMFGQYLFIAGNCDFLNLRTGINGALYYGNHRLSNVNNCLFNECKVGIQTFGAGTNLTNNTFLNNEEAISSQGLEYNSFIKSNTITAPLLASYSDQTINGGSIGVVTHGNNGTYDFNNNTINNVNTALHAINNDVKLRCNDLSNNEFVLYGSTNSKINMSTLLGAGYNDASNAIKFAEFNEANFFEANQGYNSFKISDQSHCYTATSPAPTHPSYVVCPIIADGSINNYTGFNTTTNKYELVAELNFWRPLYFPGNIIEHEYFNVTKAPLFSSVQKGELIIGTPLTSITQAGCPTNNGGGSGGGPSQRVHPLDINSINSSITTPSFYNKSLRDALVFSMNKMDNMKHVTKLNQAADLLTEILKFNYTSPILNQNDKYLLEVSYQKLFSCVAQLTELYSDSLGANSLPPSLNNRYNDLHSIINLRLSRKGISEIDYKEATDLIRLDDALIYGLARQRTNAISIINGIIASNPKNEHVNLLEHWRCIYSTEEDAINHVISTENAFASLLKCNNDYMVIKKQKTASGARKGNSNPLDEVSYAKDNAIAVYPNPTQGSVMMAYDLKDYTSITFEIFDVQGKKMASYDINAAEHQFNIDNLNLENGVYVYSIKADGKNLMTKKIVVMK